MSCSIKDLFGKPGEGLHKYRIGPFAIIDIVATIVVALILAYILPKTGFFVILLVLLLVGIIVHRMLGVRTSLDKMIMPLA